MAGLEFSDEEDFLLKSSEQIDDFNVINTHMYLETSSARKCLKSQGLLLNTLFLRDQHSKLTGFMQLVKEKKNLEFFKLLRVTKITFNRLAERLTIHEEFQQLHFAGKPSIEVDMSLMITLWYLGRQCTYSELCEQFAISLGTAHRHVGRVIKVINDVYKHVIKWPSINIVSKVEKEFRKLCNFPGVIAAIDGCHIKIRAPEDFQKDYLDRTMNHSINLIAACDSNKKFLYVYIGFPGSAHDQRVLSNSPLELQLEIFLSLCYSDNYHIIGDSAFTLKPYMMVPFRDTGNLDAKQINYNTKLSMTRRVIENSFAWLKGRFRRLKYIEADLSRITNIVTAACILHNITLDCDEERDLLENDLEVETEAPVTADILQNFIPESTKGINKKKYNGKFN